MNIAVSDASPIHYLILVEGIEILGQLFDEVFIPESGFSELAHGSTPSPVKNWMASHAPWLQIRPDPTLTPPTGIHLGEHQAICLAESLTADVVLIDDRKARLAVEKRNLAVAGTIAVLVLAARGNFIDLSEAF